MTSETASQSTQRVPSASSRDRLREPVIDDPRGVSASSTPSDADADWVSPFTLPPLPALRRNRDQSSLLKSPDHLRQRGGSEAYYAAAWGSPYASPSPESAQKRTSRARRSIDDDLYSSPGNPNSPLAPAKTRARHSVDLGDSPQARRKPVTAKSERPNWLSDSEDSESERPPTESRTPVARRGLGTWGPSPIQSPVNSSPSSRQTHETHESVDTVTPDNFTQAKDRSISRKIAQSKMSLVEEPPLDPSPDADPQKALPDLPKHSRQNSNLAKMDSPLSPSRPRMGSINSFQKQRKKVVWKGKNCIISLPMTDRESAGLPPVLSPQDVKDRIASLRLEGYSTQGFELTDVDGSSATFDNGQSRAPYPDPAEMLSERQMRSYKVYIPDQSEWQKWVDYLQEEKLRALGVTPSNSEPVQSGPSPLSALSRNSSRFPGPISPPIGTSSAASPSMRVTSNPFSPAFSASSGRGSGIGSGNSSHMNGFPGAMHGYKGSLAFLPGQGRITSPIDFVPGQSPFGPNGRSSANGHARHQTNFSPVNVHGIRSLDQVLSPLNGPPINSQQPELPKNQSYFPQQPMNFAQKSQGPSPSTLSPPAASSQSANIPRTPSFEHTSRIPVEIQHPTPRSHRHNLSAALQKEIDDAEEALAKQDQEADEKPIEAPRPSKVIEVEEEPEEAQEELPILKRPETMGGADDRSEIETNPSIAGTPMLPDDKNPFTKWQALSDAARGDRPEPAKAHKSQPSLSKFNVEAKEFNPTGGFQSSNFNFGANSGIKPFAAPFQPAAAAFQPQISKPNVPAFQPSHGSKPSLSRFNVEAPSFVPTTIKADAPSFVPGTSFEGTVDITEKKAVEEKDEEKKSAPEPSPFKFSSATFNVDAPAFNPLATPSKVFKPFLGSGSETEQVPRSSIFGKVDIEPGTQATRRNKALPIVRPRSKDGPASSASPEAVEEPSEEEEGPDGRAVLPTDRAKRARRAGSDGDRSPVFADSAPFRNNSRILSEIVNDAETRESTPEKPAEKATDGWSYIPAEPENLPPKSATPPRASRSPGRSSPFAFRNEDDAVKFSAAVPRSPEMEEQAPEDLALSPVRQELASTEQSNGAEQKPKSALSAVAEPFDFVPSQPAPPQAAQAVPEPGKTASKAVSKPKPKGLMASRFAATPSPPSSPAPVPKDVSPLPIMKEVPAAQQDVVLAKVSETVEDDAMSEESDLGEPAGTIEASSAPHSPSLVKHEPESSYPSSTVPPDLHERVASLASSRYAPHAAQNISLSSSRYAPHHDSSSALASPAYIPGRKELPRVEFSDDGDDLMPSFEEIDAVMKQFENNPELGIERNDSPVQSTPLVDMRLGNNFRSDAPSPSPRRIDRHIDTLDTVAGAPAFGLGLGINRLNSAKEEVSDWNDAISSTEEAKLHSRAQFFDGHVNDLVDGVLENRLGPLERTLQTIQHSIALMATRPGSKHKSLSSDVKESDADDEDEYNAYEGFSAYRSRSPDTKRNRRTSRIRAAVAEGIAQYRETIPPPESGAAIDLAQLRAELAEMRELVQQGSSHQQLQSDLAEMRQLLEKGTSGLQQKDLKDSLAEVIASHPRLRGSRVQQDHEASATNVKLQLDGLEAMLKVEQERAEHEARLRKQKEDEISELRQRLQAAEDEAAEQREASDQAEQNLKAFVQEKEAYHALQQQVQQLNMVIDEQEENLNEYRRYKEERQEDLERFRHSNQELTQDLESTRTKIRELALTIEDERLRNKDLSEDLDTEENKNKELTRTLWDVKDQLEERTKASRALNNKTEMLRNEVTHAVRELGREQAEWRQREHELLTKITIIEGALDSASRSKEKAEVDHDYVAKQLKDALVYKDQAEHLKMDLSKAHEAMTVLRAERIKQEDIAYRLDRELAHVKESKAADIGTATARLQAEADGARSQLEGLKVDSEARIARLQARLDTAEIDIEDHKAKYDSAIAEAEEARKQALHEQAEKHEAALEEQRSGHDRHLADLRDRHTRAMHNSSDDKHRLEHQFNEKLALSEDKIKHLESKVMDLEERLDVTRSAARAAVEAATAKGVNLPTPASSVVASPPQRAQSASLSMMKGSELPEKIPVQSLRESIIVLQDQLRDREQKIDKLEADLEAVDKEAPTKLKAQETELTWLRELLGVRIDDIEDIIQTLSKPDYDRESVKDAAIRLKASIQMEQQIRERAASNAGVSPALPSLSSLASYAQSPRTALPMAAAAAWGNFRKASNVSMSTLGHLANEYAATPSKSRRAVSPAGSWSSGIMTPPNTIQSGKGSRAPSSDEQSSMQPPPMRPLAAAAAARKMSTPTPKASAGAVEARPLRAFSSQPRALRTKLESVQGGDPLAEGSSVRSPSPETPTTIKGRENIDLGDDIDDDASPLDERGELKPFDDVSPKLADASNDPLPA